MNYLYETSNIVDIISYDLSSPQSGRGNGSSATVGAQGPAGSASQVGFDQAILNNGTVIRCSAAGMCAIQ